MTPSWLKPLGIDSAAWRKEGRLVISADDAYALPYGNDLAKGIRSGINAYVLQGKKPVAALIHSRKAAIHDTDLQRYGRLLWNQGLVSVLIVRLAKTYHIYSVIHKDRGRDIPTLIEEVKDAIDVLPSIEEGLLFERNKGLFPKENRIDQFLLNNLEAARRKLVDLGLSPSAAQSLLLQVIFIAYLEDREIIGESIISQATGGKHRKFADILATDDIRAFKGLFAKLKRDFNGDVFVSPGSFDTQSPCTLSAGQLFCLLGFRRADVTPSGQRLLFYMYDFKYIPVTLLSAIYDRFLQIDDEPGPITISEKLARRSEGSYYTPATLAQVCLDLAWEHLPAGTVQQDNFSLLDPACGSGIFLVSAFQRLIGLSRQKSKYRQSIPWSILVKVLQEKLNGCDKEARALRVGIVSLYIALLEHMEPPAIDKLRERGHFLPKLFKTSMFNSDFFEFSGKADGYDLIIGNPPWISRDANSAIRAKKWVKEQYPEKKEAIAMMPNQSPTWGFVWKSACMIKSDGIVGLLINASHLFGIQSREALRNLLVKYQVLGIVNFSDARFQLFEHAKAPAAFVILRKHNDSAGEDRHEHMFFWSPKANPNFELDKRVALSPEDRFSLSNQRLLDNPEVLSLFKWGQGRDFALLEDLTEFSALSERMIEWRDCKNMVHATKWIIGQGYNSGDRIDAPKSINNFDFLSATCKPFRYSFIKQCLSQPNVEPMQQPRVDRLRLTQPIVDGRVTPPFVLIKQGIQRPSGRLQVSYTERRIIFTKSLQAIVSPNGMADSDTFKILTAALNSSLAAWFFLHRGAEIGIERDKIHQHELLHFPFPLPAESPLPEAGKAIVEEMTNYYLKCGTTQAGQIISSKQLTLFASDENYEHDESELANKLDSLVLDYYGLTDSEKQVVNDTAKYILPSLQPRGDSEPVLWQQPGIQELEGYAHWLKNALEGNYSKKIKISVTVYQDNGSLLVVEAKRGAKSVSRVEPSSTALRTKLGELHDRWPSAFTRGIDHLADLTLAEGDRIVLIKPNRIRYWMPSSGLNDADRIVTDLRKEAARRGESV